MLAMTTITAMYDVPDWLGSARVNYWHGRMKQQSRQKGCVCWIIYFGFLFAYVRQNNIKERWLFDVAAQSMFLMENGLNFCLAKRCDEFIWRSTETCEICLSLMQAITFFACTFLSSCLMKDRHFRWKGN